MGLILSWAVVILAWQWPATYPQVDHFILGALTARTATRTAFSVAPSLPGQCVGLPGADAETHCAAWPTCPAQGEIVVFWVQAEADGTQGPACNPMVACHFIEPCICSPVGLPPMPDMLPDLPVFPS